MSTLNELAKRINEISTEHGFWPEEGRDFGEMLALARSEMAEALEQHRDDNEPVYHVAKIDRITATSEQLVLYDEYVEFVNARQTPPGPLTAELSHHGMLKPEGALVELADTYIRLLDTVFGLNYDIEDAVVQIPPPTLSDSTFGAAMEDIHLMLSQAWLVAAGGDEPKCVEFLCTAIVAIPILAEKWFPGVRPFIEVVEEKMFYNSKRPYKHGRNY